MGNASIGSTNYNLKGKIVVVTGANTGIGKETVKGLARYGAHIVLACRSLDKGKSAIEEIKAELPDASLDLLQLDLNDWDNIKNFITEYKAKYQHMDILINNAGICTLKYEKSKHNYDSILTVNYLGTVVLTEYCLELLSKAPEDHGRPRIVFVASNSHNLKAELDLKELELDQTILNQEVGLMKMMNLYGRSKLCLLLYSMLLNSKLRKENSRILVYSVDPGFTDTGLGSGGEEKFYTGFIRSFQSMVAKTAADGAVPSIYCACDSGLEDVSKSGQYYDGIDKLGPLSEVAKNTTNAETLWKWTTTALQDYLK